MSQATDTLDTTGARLLHWLRGQFEIGRHGRGGNLAAMEGLRGLAVMLVLCVHFVDQVLPLRSPAGSDPAALHALAKIGHSGVDLFFVLSGYLIYGSLIGRPTPFVPYMRRRLQRIYPTFLAVFALYLVLSAAIPSHGKLPDDAWKATWSLLLNLLLLPGMLPIEPFIAVAWSLSYEMFFYLVMPLLIAVSGMRGWPSATRMLALAAAAAAITVACALWTGPVRLSQFLVGALLHEWLVAQRGRPAPALLASLAVAGAFALSALRPDGSVGYAWRTAGLGAAFFLLCAASFGGSQSTWLSRLFSITPLRWLGNMSYSYYLIHGLALQAFFLVARPFAAGEALSVSVLGLLWALGFLVSLVPSALLYIAIERPMSLAPVRARAAA